MNHQGDLPWSIDEVERLVLSLYDPARHSSLAGTQETLQLLQRSTNGWLLARLLLERPDDKVKFFGALTVIVKLNTASSSLHPGDVVELLCVLVEWLGRAIHDKSGPLVSRKLTSALATHYLHFPSSWPRFIYYAALGLGSAQRHVPDSVDYSNDLAIYLERLSPSQLHHLLWLATAVAEDAARLDLNSPAHIGLFRCLVSNVGDSVALMATLLSSPPLDPGCGHGLGRDSIKCFQAWVWFAQRASSYDSDLIGSLRELSRSVIGSVLADELFETSADALSEILTNFSAFFRDPHYDLICALFETPQFQDRYRRLVSEHDPETDAILLGHLLLALGDAKVQDMMQSKDARSTAILDGLCGLLTAQGTPAVTDKIFVPAIEFWSTFIETMTDCISSDECGSPSWVPAATEFVRRAVSHVWQKIVYPEAEAVGSWDSADRASFVEARKDAADLILASYTVLGAPLVETFADVAVQALAASSWPQLEAAAFSLAALADSVSGDVSNDSQLCRVFSDGFFGCLGQGNARAPQRTSQACLSLVEKYADYFERHPDFLPMALNQLFSGLGIPQLSTPASRSILRLCASCRSHLTGEIDAFFRQLGTLSSGELLDCPTMERILGAIAAVVQAVDDEDAQMESLARLISFIDSDASRSLAAQLNTTAICVSLSQCRKLDRCVITDSVPDETLHLLLRALRCLVSVGRNLRSPPGSFVDLEENSGGKSRFCSPSMAKLQTCILELIVRSRSAFPSSGEVVETICQILRTGFSEPTPGLLYLPAWEVCNIFTCETLATPRIGVLVSTACSFLSSLIAQGGETKAENLTRMLLWVMSLLRGLPALDEEIELIQSGIDFVNRSLNTEPAVLFQSLPVEDMEFFLVLTVNVMDGHEPLPKAAAADFWVVLLTLATDNPETQANLDKAVTLMGPALSRCLVRGVGGAAARSELDKLAEPLKRLVSHHSKSREWLREALDDPTLQCSQLSEADRSLFLKRLISLRGARTTNQVVRDFWLASRGSNFAYAS